MCLHILANGSWVPGDGCEFSFLKQMHLLCLEGVAGADVAKTRCKKSQKRKGMLLQN